LGNQSTSTIALTVLAQLEVRRGETSAEAALDLAWERASVADPPRLWPVVAARAEAAWLSGRGELIVALVGEAFELARQLSQPWAIGELGYWLWRAGRITSAPTGSAPPYAHQINGDWRAAAGAWDAIGCPYEAALARADGDDVTELEAALRTLSGLGAQPAADLVRRRLRQSGARRVPPAPRRATRANPGGVTDRELQVLALLVCGLSNAEIAARLHISRRTADHHVGAILVKLDVPTRREAARVARERGLLAGESGRGSDGPDRPATGER
jgi:DNA-binding CsgD family transcriptional regulator